MTDETLETTEAPKILPTLAIKINGDPLDPIACSTFIKPAELVDAVEISPLNRSELVLYNQLLANAWNDIAPGQVYSVVKSRLRGSHESNDRLHEAFDRLMASFAKVKYRDPETGMIKTVCINLLGPNVEEDGNNGKFYYTLHPTLLDVLEKSRSWARLRCGGFYVLRSKYSIRLYEIVAQRINMRRQSESFSEAELRGMLGVPKGKLKRFADFNKHCLKPAVAEINHITDYLVNIGLRKRKRRIEFIYMTWLKKAPESRLEAAKERERLRVARAERYNGTFDVIL